MLRLLIVEHELPRPVASREIGKHRHLVTEDGVGAAFLHFGPEDFAESIHIRLQRDQKQERTTSVFKAVIASKVKKESGAVTFIRRLTANDLGLTGSHQGGSIYIPKDAEKFFPPLQGTRNPFSTIKVKFVGPYMNHSTYLFQCVGKQK